MIKKAKADKAKGPQANATASPKTPSPRTLWFQGFLTSASNPKAVVFFAALFPQFISPDHAFAAQFLILAVTYIIMDALFLSAYGLGASWIAARFTGAAEQWIERIGGGFMIGAATLLGAKSLGPER